MLADRLAESLMRTALDTRVYGGIRGGVLENSELELDRPLQYREVPWGPGFGSLSIPAASTKIRSTRQRPATQGAAFLKRCTVEDEKFRRFQ